MPSPIVRPMVTAVVGVELDRGARRDAQHTSVDLHSVSGEPGPVHRP